MGFSWNFVNQLSKEKVTLMAEPPIPLEPRNDPFHHALSNTSRLVFKRLLHFPVLPSTNAYLKPLAAVGEPEGLIVLADEQTAGTGRLNRVWHSPKGGLYFSSLVRPMSIAASDTPLITLTTGIAVAKVLNSALGIDAKLKWPNDVLLDDRKVGGILVESAFIGSDIEYAVIGIGINANITSSDFPKSLRRSVTSLQEKLIQPIDLPRLFEYLVGQLEFWYLKLRDKGFKAIEPHYRRLCSTLGKQVTVDLEEKQVAGLAKALNADGSLIIQTTEGRQIIRSGDVVSSTTTEENA
jgi:BirA family biotin operon repressor/biotin-[acetyl-CoA-carboxylase] ligase